MAEIHKFSLFVTLFLSPAQYVEPVLLILSIWSFISSVPLFLLAR